MIFTSDASVNIIFHDGLMNPCIHLIESQQLYTVHNGLASWGRHGRDRMVVGLITTYAISVYHHLRCEFESRSWRGGLYDNGLRQ